MSGEKESSGWKYELSLRVMKLLNVLAVTTTFAVIWYLTYSDLFKYTILNLKFWVVIGLYAVLYVTLGRIYNAFMLSMSRVSEMVLSQILAMLISGGALHIAFGIASSHPFSLWPMITTLIIQAVLSVIWCISANRWYRDTFCARSCVIVYDSRNDIGDLLHKYDLHRKFSVKASVTVEECMADMPGLFDNRDTVFLWGISSHERNKILKYCVEHGIRSYLIPRIGDMLVNSGKVVHMFHLPMLSVERFVAPPGYFLVKRVSDILICCAALLLLSPVMLITAIAIKLTDHGPVFYKQTRLTKDRKEFEVLKFRSMRVDAEQDGVARLSSGKTDSRITPVGRLIRTVRIDELPQLFNIIKGDMSIVGPRPERPEIAAEYEKTLPEFALRLQVPAGLTGYAQVYGKYNTPPYDKLQMDLLYISHASFLEDLRIMFATVKTLFTIESTEGVSEEQTTADR